MFIIINTSLEIALKFYKIVVQVLCHMVETSIVFTLRRVLSCRHKYQGWKRLEFVAHCGVHFVGVQALTSEEVKDRFWDTKLRVVEITSMVLKAVGYGSVILTATERTQLVKVWLPFIRETKPVLESQFAVEKMSLEMDVDLCQSIENALVSLVLSLPSGDQAEILADWLRWDHARFSPHLSKHQ